MGRCEIRTEFYSRSLWGRCRCKNIVKLRVRVLTRSDWGRRGMSECKPCKRQEFLDQLSDCRLLGMNSASRNYVHIRTRGATRPTTHFSITKPCILPTHTPHMYICFVRFSKSITLRCVIPVVCVTRWEGEGSSKQHN